MRQPEPSQIEGPSKVAQIDMKKKETNKEVVQALTDHLNQITEIDNAEASETKRDTYRNPSFGTMPKMLEKPSVR